MLSLTAASRDFISSIVKTRFAMSRQPLPGMRCYMNCAECRDLYRMLERRNAKYVEARSAAFFRVSPQLAARKHLELQRALSDLQEHQAECPWALTAEHVGRRLTARPS